MLLMEIWQAHWEWSGTGDVADTVSYPLDAWNFRQYFHDDECNDMFRYSQARTNCNQ